MLVPPSTIRRRTAPVLLAAAMVLSLAAGHPGASVAQTVNCDVNPYQAWQVAQPRGWNFSCDVLAIGPGMLASSTFLPEPMNRIGCMWRTGPIPTPRGGPWVRMRLFERGDFRRGNGELRQGWRISAWELSGGQFERRNPDDRIRLQARMQLGRHNHTFRYRLTRLVLSKSGGNCANALNEAF